MKMNKWTMALAAAGVVSLSSVAQAQEAAAGANALAASTTLSGYVSTSYTNDNVAAGDDDRFNLDVVDLKFASAQGAGEYAAGYTVEIWAGGSHALDTANAGDPGTVEVLQANIDLRLPWGNGVDLKIGQFETVVGAEVSNRNENPFYTHSQAFGIEPTHHTGVLASYQATDDLSVAIGVVNDTTSNRVNDETGGGSAYLVQVGYTIPDSAGILSGTQLTYGRVEGAGHTATADTDNQYLGASIPLPIEGLSYSVAWDIQEIDSSADSNVLGHYLSYAATDTMTLNFRYETGNILAGDVDGLDAWTVGLDYQLWENVISRVEFNSVGSDAVGADTETMVFNVIYSF